MIGARTIARPNGRDVRGRVGLAAIQGGQPLIERS